VRLNDAVIGLGLILFALAMMAYTRTFPAMPGQDYGPALFPVLIGIGFLVTGAILVASGLSRLRTEPLLSGVAWMRKPHRVLSFLAVVLGLLFYIVAADWLGFIPTAALLLFVLLAVLRQGRPLSSLVIALIATLAVNYVFTKFLLVPLPLGLLQQVIY
jgi:putative tricarboxylic transport membrane protein